MFNTLKAFGLYAILSITPIRGCLPPTTHGIKYVSQNVPTDTFERISQKLKPCTPDRRAEMWEKLEENLTEDHANPEITVKATLRGFSCP